MRDATSSCACAQRATTVLYCMPYYPSGREREKTISDSVVVTGNLWTVLEYSNVEPRLRVAVLCYICFDV